MTTPPSIPICLEKRISSLDGSIFVENVDINLLNALINSNHLKDKFDTSNYTQKLASQLYTNEKHQLISYLNNYDKKLNAIKVQYKKPRHKYGRVFPVKSLGLTCLSKKIRNTLIKGKYIDFDIKNAQPEIIYNICKSNNLIDNFPHIEGYVLRREDILQEVTYRYQVTRDDAKKLFIRLAFFGTFYGWLEELGLDTKIQPTLFINGFKEELNKIANIIRQHNPILYETCRKQKEAKGKTNIIGSMFSLYLQDYEENIMDVATNWISNNTKIMDYQNSIYKENIYEFDGFKLNEEKVYYYGGHELIITNLENIILKVTGFKLQIEVKPIEKFFEIEYTRYIYPEEIQEKEKEKEKDYTLTDEETERLFENFVIDFEKTHCKIINKAFFMKTTRDEFIPLSHSQLMTGYSHEYYLEKVYDDKGILIGTKKKKFLTAWLSHEYNIKKFEDVKIYPNNSLCPSDIFNLWKPFAMELLTDKYEPNIKGRDILLNHIKVLCNYDEVVYNYLIAWIAQMIQYPEVKSICPVLISKQGAGKSTFLQLMSKMLGSSKYFETTSPSRDVWGQFNGRMASAFLVNLNELSKKDTIDVEGYIKGLITDSTIFINNKGVNGFEIPSYHRFIITTNKDDGGIRTSDDDRRNVIIRSSDDKIGDKEYFNKMYELLEDINVIRTCYDYFKNIEGMKDFGKISLPVTEYQKNLKELSRSPEESWLIDFTTENDDKEEVENLGVETYNEFKNWCVNNGLENYNTTCLKLGVKLTNMNINGISKGKHTNKGYTKIFNIKKLKKHFGIGVLDILIKKVNDDVEIETEL